MTNYTIEEINTIEITDNSPAYVVEFIETIIIEDPYTVEFIEDIIL